MVRKPRTRLSHENLRKQAKLINQVGRAFADTPNPSDCSNMQECSLGRKKEQSKLWNKISHESLNKDKKADQAKGQAGARTNNPTIGVLWPHVYPKCYPQTNQREQKYGNVNPSAGQSQQALQECLFHFTLFCFLMAQSLRKEYLRLGKPNLFLD